MAKKSKASAKKSSKPAATNKQVAANAKSVKRATARPTGSRGKGAANRGSVQRATIALQTVQTSLQFPTFEQAKCAAIDSLVTAIEDAESRLMAVKQANTYLDLNRLMHGPAL